MKTVKYKFLSSEVNIGTYENPDIEQIFITKEMTFNNDEEFNHAIPYIEAEAYNGEYEVFDDGKPETDAEATTDDVLNAMLGVIL